MKFVNGGVRSGEGSQKCGLFFFFCFWLMFEIALKKNNQLNPIVQYASLSEMKGKS